MNVDDVFYQVSKEVYEEKITKSKGIDKLVNEYHFNKGSSNMIVGQIFPKFINGEKFTRTLSVNTFDCFLRNVLRDYGDDRLIVVLSGLKKHIDYIKEKGDSKIKLRKVYNRYLDLTREGSANLSTDDKEQVEIEKYYKKYPRTKLIKDLAKSIETEVKVVQIKSKSYKRNNKVIALIKILRGYECQMCGYSILKKDGNEYIEAAHIIPKHKKGNETPENILILCPNHHKEFDLGNLIIQNHNPELIEFTLNKKKYSINLSIE
jgi:5-methylcytosine-specific restriction protein A